MHDVASKRGHEACDLGHEARPVLADDLHGEDVIGVQRWAEAQRWIKGLRPWSLKEPEEFFAVQLGFADDCPHQSGADLARGVPGYRHRAPVWVAEEDVTALLAYGFESQASQCTFDLPERDRSKTHQRHVRVATT